MTESEKYAKCTKRTMAQSQNMGINQRENENEINVLI